MNDERRIAIFFAVFAVLFTGGHAHAYSIGEPSRIWKRSVLRACWLADAAPLRKRASTWGEDVTEVDRPSRQRRAFVQQIVRANFPRSLTGIDIAPFEDCPKGAAIAKFDVLLGAEIRVKNDDGDTFGRSSVGDDSVELDREMIEHLDLPKADRRSFLGLSLKNESEHVAADLDGFFETLKDVFPESLIRSSEYAKRSRAFRARFANDRYRLTIVHEFGHLLGLRHEESRGDTPMGLEIPFCADLASDLRDDRSITPGAETSTLGTEFDLFSIMNYCRRTMLDYAEKARFVCAFKDRYAPAASMSAAHRRAFEAILERCPFIEAHEFPMGLTTTDRAGLRKLYLGIDPPDSAVDFRNSPVKSAWVDLFRAMWVDE